MSIRRESVHKLLLHPGSRHVALVLNRPLPHFASRLLMRMDAIVAVDGGLNRLSQLARQVDRDAGGDYRGSASTDGDPLSAASAIILAYALPTPLGCRDKLLRCDLVIGDFDSISDAELQRAKEAGAQVRKELDQDSTDFQKALRYLLGQDYMKGGVECESSDLLKDQDTQILVFGGLDGRLDHTLQNLNTALAHVDCGHRIIFVEEESCAEMLPAGKTELILTEADGPHCGLLPLKGIAKVQTTGLKWNLTNDKSLEMQWGHLLSTSNMIQAPHLTVTVDTNVPLLWIIENKV